MLSKLNDMLSKLNGWKKITATVMAVAGAAYGAPPEATYALIAYILGQGVADVGKEQPK